MRLPVVPFVLLACSLACAHPGGDDSVADAPQREGESPGECIDGADNDGDGEFDCDDPDCEGAPDCDAEDTEDTEDTEECGDAQPPGIESLVLSAHAGLVTAEEGSYPALDVAVEADDCNGDLDNVTVWYWYDARIDGAVDTDATPTETRIGYGSPGSTFEASILLILEVDGRTIEYETRYEFAVQVADSSGNVSEILIADGDSPDATGN